MPSAMFWKVELTLAPAAVTATMHTIAMRSINSAYSSRSWPSSRRVSDFRYCINWSWSFNIASSSVALEPRFPRDCGPWRSRSASHPKATDVPSSCAPGVPGGLTGRFGAHLSDPDATSRGGQVPKNGTARDNHIRNQVVEFGDRFEGCQAGRSEGETATAAIVVQNTGFRRKTRV